MIILRFHTAIHTFFQTYFLVLGSISGIACNRKSVLWVSGNNLAIQAPS